MSRFELYSPEGLRVDGRRFNELRHFDAQLGTHTKSADGSASVEMGNSRVICMILGPQEPRSRSASNNEKATLSINVVVAPFSTTERLKHTSAERPLQEMAITLKETFEAAVITKFAPRTEIVVNLSVLAQDGNMLAACANAITLALVDAGVPMLEYLSAISVAVMQDTPLLDPNQIEIQELPYLTVGVLGKSRKVSLLVLEKRMLMDSMPAAVDLGIEACQLVREMMDDVVRARLNGSGREVTRT